MAMDTTGTFPYDFPKVVYLPFVFTKKSILSQYIYLCIDTFQIRSGSVGVHSSYRASEQGDVSCVVRRVASSHPLHIQIDS